MPVSGPRLRQLANMASLMRPILCSSTRNRLTASASTPRPTVSTLPLSSACCTLPAKKQIGRMSGFSSYLQPASTLCRQDCGRVGMSLRLQGRFDNAACHVRRCNMAIVPGAAGKLAQLASRCARAVFEEVHRLEAQVGRLLVRDEIRDAQLCDDRLHARPSLA